MSYSDNQIVIVFVHVKMIRPQKVKELKEGMRYLYHSWDLGFKYMINIEHILFLLLNLHC